MTTIAATNALIEAMLREPIEEIPLSPIVGVHPGCGLPMVEMVYQHRPEGMSVYEAKCRDHRVVTA